MQLFRPLLAALSVLCLIVILKANASVVRRSTTTLSAARPMFDLRRALRGNPARMLEPELKPSDLLAFVGVFTAFDPARRQSLRETWFPATPELLQRFEKTSKVRLRFVVGSHADSSIQASLEEEQTARRDFHILAIQDTYDNLVLKVYTFLKDVQAKFDPAYIIKTDDDLYIRPDRLAQAIPQWQAEGAGYVGVMRTGTDAHDSIDSPWYEPLGVLINKQYYMYASGGMYGLSAAAVRLLTSIPMKQHRLSGGGDDTSIGLWVMAYNITYMDDRRLGADTEDGNCPDNFIVLTGECNGLCDSATLLPQLHQNPSCTRENTGELPRVAAWYDYSDVGCIRIVNGNVNKTLCQGDRGLMQAIAV